MKLKYKYLKYLFMLVDTCCLIPSILFCVQIMESSEQLQAKERRTVTKITVENQVLSDNLDRVSASLQKFINEYEQIQQEIVTVKKRYDELEVNYKKGVYLDSIAAELDHEIGSKAYISRYFQVQKEELQSILDASNLSVGLDAVFPGAEAWGELLPVGDKIWLRYSVDSFPDDFPEGVVIQNPALPVGYREIRSGMYLFDIEEKYPDSKVEWYSSEGENFRYLRYEDDVYSYYYIAIPAYGDSTITYITPNNK